MTAAAPTALRPPFTFTHHAIERFVKRVWPTVGTRAIADDREALTLLCNATELAELMPRRTALGDALWSVKDPAMRWITKPGEFKGRRVAVVVTVLAGADDPVAEEKAERDVLDASRRLLVIPELGLSESTAPTPGPEESAELKAYRAWIALEVQRLAVERERLRKLNTPEIAALERARISLEQTKLADVRQEAARRERTARHLATQAKEALFCELLARLAEVDAAGSADLLERARERVAKWEAEGRLVEDEQ